MTDEINPGEYRDTGPWLTIPDDPLAQQRIALINKYGFNPVASPVFDAIAAEVIAEFEGVIDFAGVNRVDDGRYQIFTGAALLDADGSINRLDPNDENRVMTAPQGACSTLITRPGVKGRTALAIDDLLDYHPYFATNDMVTKMGKRTYIGAQIVTPEGVPIGTVWGVGPKPHSWKQPHLNFMKGRAEGVMTILTNRMRP